jgi:hypothetical protein
MTQETGIQNRLLVMCRPAAYFITPAREFAIVVLRFRVQKDLALVSIYLVGRRARRVCAHAQCVHGNMGEWRYSFILDFGTRWR